MSRLPQRPGDRPLVMGVVNVTPDSFSDGGRWLDPASAIEHGLALLQEGADLLDIGGESTRPGASRPAPQEEIDRVVPVVRGLAALGAVVSVDTMRAQVATAALEAGAAIVNDVSGGLADEAMAATVAAAGVPFVAMHWRGHSKDMQSRTHYDDVVQDVCRELASRRDALLAAGIAADQLVLDPGLGFAKTAAQNWTLLGAIDTFTALGQPLLVGASRKSFLGTVGSVDGSVVPADQRDAATAAVSVLLAQAEVWGIRVHEVHSTRAACDVIARVREAGRG
ncbi:dihydropteroate synthase [Calidifontibacter sp. DB0510]|uniref:Dihydropteroate synthase n=1 Tax=Metallococcus carri TaxID=1656884 RepID=A0A967E9M3_9MICO|nr:dihydropteroate synthase [Metallococcus carri]NHN55365.1 dihydropteroate synthase [Metallococcus carri]NOP36442.1 dihydropteroate synthase [Calidifontibacter sp. DB2511S]